MFSAAARAYGRHMTTRTITRLGAGAGAAYVLLAFVGNDVLGSAQSPAADAPPAAFARWLADSRPRGADWIAPFLELLALLCFVVFAAALYDTLRRAERERTWLPAAALGAGLVSAAIKLSSAPPMLAAYELARRGIDPQLGAALVDINGYAFLLTWAVDAVMIGAVAAVALRTVVLPRWLAISGAALSPLLLASVALGEDGPPVFLLALLWFVAVSVALARPASRVRTPASSAAPAGS
jgi:Domain of unknown function (DUF4386)